MAISIFRITASLRSSTYETMLECRDNLTPKVVADVKKWFCDNVDKFVDMSTKNIISGKGDK